jgi:hypothetical protein
VELGIRLTSEDIGQLFDGADKIDYEAFSYLVNEDDKKHAGNRTNEKQLDYFKHSAHPGL